MLSGDEQYTVAIGKHHVLLADGVWPKVRLFERAGWLRVEPLGADGARAVTENRKIEAEPSSRVSMCSPDDHSRHPGFARFQRDEIADASFVPTPFVVADQNTSGS